MSSSSAKEYMQTAVVFLWHELTKKGILTQTGCPEKNSVQHTYISNKENGVMLNMNKG